MLRARFESPIHESRARTKLLKLSQRKGEDACAYMAWTRSLLQRVPGIDEKTALLLWIYGLREPFRFEAAKTNPKIVAEVEILVACMEDAISGKADSDQQNERNKQGKRAGNASRIVRTPPKAHNNGNRKYSRYGQAEELRPSLSTDPCFHPGYQSRESGHCG